MASQTLLFRDKTIRQLPVPKRKRSLYHDKHEGGLQLYITPHGARTFFIRRRVRGRDQRIIIGSTAQFKVSEAREQARHINQQIEIGLDPMIERRRDLSERTKFGKHLADYLYNHSKIRKKRWQQDHRIAQKYLGPWHNKYLDSISRAEVRRLYNHVYDTYGQSQAKVTKELVCAIFNKAIEWGWDGTNPSSHMRTYRHRARDRFVMPAEMPFLIKALDTDANELMSDYFWMLLLTGARRTNQIMMRWNEINWEHQTWHIPHTKNGDPIVIPLIEPAIKILQRRKSNSQSEWVFPSKRNNGKPFCNLKRAWKRITLRATIYKWSEDEQLASIIEDCRKQVARDAYTNRWIKLIHDKAKRRNIVLPQDLTDLRMHDLRRTFGSYQAISGSSMPIIAKSLGHRSLRATEVYARLDTEPVRKSIHRAVEQMLISKKTSAYLPHNTRHEQQIVRK